MKVLFLPKWYPNKNDIQHGIFIKNHAKALSKITRVGVLFAVTSPLVKEIEIETEEEGNYFSVTVYFPKKSNRLLALYSYYKAFSKGKDILFKKWGLPDVITLYILGRNYMMYKKFWPGIPFVVSEQWSGYLNGGMENYIYAKRRNTLNALNRASAIIAVSSPLASALKKYSNNSQIHIVPNIVYYRLNLENKISSVIKVLTVADLKDKVKNISGMMDALAEVSSTRKIEFTIIGEGDDEDFLKNKYKQILNENLLIHFKKRMPHDELMDNFENANFYLLNSPFETFCVAAAEAVACGRPVVATRCGGPEEFLNESNAVLCEKNNTLELKAAILKMIENLERGLYIPAEIASTIHQRYGADAIAKQYFTILEAAINKKPN